MFDHITLRVADLDAARRMYGAALAALGFDDPAVDADFTEWGDLSISRASADRPITRAAHVAVAAPSRAAVDSFWRVATGAGFADEGKPALRSQHDAESYGAFVLDRDENALAAVHQRAQPGSMIDHVVVGVADLQQSRAFYECVLHPLRHGLSVSGDDRDRENSIAFGTRGASLRLLERPPTKNLHIAFAAPDNASVDAFHRDALAAGYRDNGPPGERDYHAGYYGAFVLDPDGNNIEAVCHNRKAPHV
jgi:catechol 2,3-dioxygenase-like lactoylglutathione lyase family enzyme